MKALFPVSRLSSLEPRVERTHEILWITFHLLGQEGERERRSASNTGNLSPAICPLRGPEFDSIIKFFELRNAYTGSQHTMVAAVVFIFGLLIGSFLNVCIYRMPRNESLAFPPSHCPACGAAIPPWHNIPVASYLLLRGHCRSCGSSISPIYPLVELLTPLLGLALYLRFGLTVQFLVLALLCASLVVVTFIDLEHQIIPDEISLPGIAIGFAASFILPVPGWRDSLLGILAGGGSLYLVAWGYERFTGKEGMGGGDVKLLAMLGAFFGWQAVPFIIFVSSLTGSVVGVTVMLVTKKDGKLAIPFGPFLVIGALVHLFFGEQLVAWYLGLFPAGGVRL